MADEELRAKVNGHDVDITELKQLVNTLIVDVVRPATEVAVAAQARSLENETRFQNLLDEAREDRMNAQARFDAQQARFDAQQQVIQSMLVQIAQMNSAIDES